MRLLHVFFTLLFSTFCIFFSFSCYSQVWEYSCLANKVQREAVYIGGEGSQLWEPANSGYTPRGACELFIDADNPARAISVGANSGKAAYI